MSIGGRHRAGGRRWGIKTAGSKFKHRNNLFPRHVEPLHDFLDTCTGFEVLENGGNWHTGVLKHPRAAYSSQHAFDGGALGPIKSCHSSYRPFIAAFSFLPQFGSGVETMLGNEIPILVNIEGGFGVNIEAQWRPAASGRVVL